MSEAVAGIDMELEILDVSAEEAYEIFLDSLWNSYLRSCV